MPVSVVIDIVLIAFIVVGAIVGMWRGFFKTIISLIGWTVSLLVAIIFARLVADVLLQIPIIGQLVLGGGNVSSLAGWVETWLPSELGTIYAADALYNETLIRNAMNNNLLGFLLNPLFHMIVDPAAAASGLTVAEIFAMAIANHIFVIIVGFLILMIVRIFVALITMAIEKALSKKEKLKKLDRVGGLFAGIFKYGLYVFIIFVGLSFIIATPFMRPARNQLDNTLITRQVARGTFWVTDRYLRGEDGLIERIIELSGRNRNNDEEEGGEQNSENNNESNNENSLSYASAANSVVVTINGGWE